MHLARHPPAVRPAGGAGDLRGDPQGRGSVPPRAHLVGGVSAPRGAPPRPHHHARAQRHRDGLLGHRRQGPRPAGVQPARRRVPRQAARLHLPVRMEGGRSSRAGRGRHPALPRPRVQRRQARPGGSLGAPSPGDSQLRRAGDQGDARGGRRPLRHPHRHPRPVDHPRGDPARQAAGALRAAVVRRAGGARATWTRWRASPTLPRSRSPPANG